MPPAAPMLSKIARWSANVKCSAPSASNAGPQSPGRCSAAFSASRSADSARSSRRPDAAAERRRGGAPRPGQTKLTASSRTRSRTGSGVGTATQPDSRRAYSSRSAQSLICATSGTTARTADTWPSAVSRSYSAIVLRMANSTSGTRPATSSRTDTSPSCCRSSHGSRPPGSIATNVCATKCWSNASALRRAA